MKTDPGNWPRMGKEDQLLKAFPLSMCDHYEVVALHL
jgi:hypothetical protein